MGEWVPECSPNRVQADPQSEVSLATADGSGLVFLRTDELRDIRDERV
jgi:hypothetical protein